MFQVRPTVPSLFKVYIKKLVFAFVVMAIALLAWTNLFSNLSCHAATINDLHLAATASGISDRIEGKVEKDIGTVQRNASKITSQTEGALKQAEGKAKQDIGTVKNKVDEAQNKAEDTSENLIDSVKDFFSN